MIHKLIQKINVWNRYFNRKEQIYLFILLLIGLSLRIINAIFTQLWRDEVYIFLTSRENSFINLLFQNHWDTAHPPLYFIFLHFWQKLGFFPFFLRLPSLIASFLILYFIPVLAKEIDDNQKYLPYFFLFFFSFSHFQLSLNMVVRPYPFVILFMILSLTIFLRFYFNLKHLTFEEIFKFIVFFSTINVLIFFTDYSGSWLLITYFLFAFIVWIFQFIKRKRISFNTLVVMISLEILLIFIIAWLPIFFKNLGQSLHLERFLAKGFIENSQNHILYNIANLFGIIEEDYLLKNNLANLNQIVYAYLFIVFFGLILLFKNQKNKFLFIFLLGALPLTLSVLISFKFYPIFLDRFINLINIFYLIAISYFFAVFFDKNIISKILILIFVVLYIFNFFGGFPKIHYVDPPYDFLKLHQILYNYPQEEKKIIFTHAPLFIFKHFDYYNLFLPIKNLEIYNLSEDFSFLKEERNEKKYFYVDFLYEKDKGHQYLRSELELKKLLKCNNISRVYIDYIYLVKCL